MNSSYSIDKKSLFRRGEVVLHSGDSTIYNIVNPTPLTYDRVVVENAETGIRKRFSQYKLHKARQADLKIISEYNNLMTELT
jgi:hypothetical protein|tara:strand:- start:94 stop:339 length:246 start_codon:yes stop_codon:yes gene_type:complete